jgi:toxin CptA
MTGAEIMLASLGFAVALAGAAAMGFAIQRGATCTVVAVTEIIERRTAWRLAAMGEAALWVAGGLLVARALGLPGAMPPGFALTPWTVAGAVLLGLGAVVNGACVFGALARLGSGEWAFLATPAGFLLGCLLVRHLPGLPDPAPLADPSPVLEAPGGVAIAFLAFAAWRVAARPWRGGRAGRIWTPHAATTVIAITFLVMLLTVGAWTYTDALADLAHGMAAGLPGRLVLFAALMAGAVLGGWSAGRLRRVRPALRDVLRCALGGALMACGGLLVPGSNDGLILLGMPLLRPYAWVAFAAMCGTVALAKLAERARRQAHCQGVRSQMRW